VAIGYRLDKPLGLTLVVWDGDITGEEAEGHARRLLADPEWPPGPLHLLDATSATSVPITADTKLVDIVAGAAKTRQIRFALVEHHGFTQAVNFERAASDRGVSRVIVFNALIGACGWLGLDLAVIGPIIDELRRDLRAAHGPRPGPSSED